MPRRGRCSSEDGEDDLLHGFRLQSGLRKSREARTRWQTSPKESLAGTLYLMTDKDFRSGRRHFTVWTRDRWPEDMTVTQLWSKLERGQYDYGKTFVLYEGQWHEALDEACSGNYVVYVPQRWTKQECKRCCKQEHREWCGHRIFPADEEERKAVAEDEEEEEWRMKGEE